MSGRAHRSFGRGDVPGSRIRGLRGVAARVPGGLRRLFAYALACALAHAYVYARDTAYAAPPIGGTIDNVATGTGRFVAGGVPFTQVSNTVRARVSAPPAPPAVAFYSGPDFATVVRFGAPGAPLYVQAAAPGCDVRSAVRKHYRFG